MSFSLPQLATVVIEVRESQDVVAYERWLSLPERDLRGIITDPLTWEASEILDASSK